MKKERFFNLDKSLKNLLKKGVEKGVYSGAAAGVYLHTENENEKKFYFSGKTRKDEQGKLVKNTSFFDLASLTKPLCTTLTTLQLIEKNKLSFETKITEIYGEKINPDLAGVEIKHLLSHSSGMRGYKEYYKEFKPKQHFENKEKIIKFILNEKPINKPGKKCLYSDLDYILLGDIVERVSEKNLDHLFITKILKPLRLEKEFCFRPVDRGNPKKYKEFAATQKCPWRKRLLQGEVDDEHSWLMGGVAGHAGLFGTVAGVLSLCACILKIWKEKGVHPPLSNKTLKKALLRQYSDQSWCLGFDTPTQPSSAGKYISPQSVGHLGFTGTSFWIDPEKNMVIVLLTNRVHPDRTNDKIKTFRPLFHNTIYENLKA